MHAERVIFQEDSKGVEDKGLFEHLRKIRKNLADEQGYPPYIVLSDKSLHELARMKPTTKNAMSLISGIENSSSINMAIHLHQGYQEIYRTITGEYLQRYFHNLRR